MMGIAVGEARRSQEHIEKKFVKLNQLTPIHPIDRKEAIEKTEQQAEALVSARHIVAEANWVLEDYMCYGHEELHVFQSLSGFEAVEVDGLYITFEGNGRREALKRGIEKIRKDYPQSNVPDYGL